MRAWAPGDVGAHEVDGRAVPYLLAAAGGALGALARMGSARTEDIAAGLADPDPRVRRRACEVAAAAGPAAVAGVGAALPGLLTDPDASVVETAAWALGEGGAASEPAVPALAELAFEHPDPLCREAAVAALGAIGDPSGLPAILAATKDRPAVRRRAVIALAPFDGPDVDEALRRALEDRDWQVRQAAEDLLDVRPGEAGGRARS
jgi:HEAT repeat protein